MAFLAVTWMLSLTNVWCMQSQRSGQVYHTVSPKKAHNRSQVSRVCVGSVYVSRDMSARNGQHD